MIAFTILGVLVFWSWCFSAGWWIAFALDVMPILCYRRFARELEAVMSGITNWQTALPQEAKR